MRSLSTASATYVPDAEAYSAEELLRYMLERFHPRLALACSFQKEEAVLLDMLLRLEPTARVFTIDTGVLFAETRATWRNVEERYGITIEVFDATRPDGVPWTAEHCCGERKVAALNEALGTALTDLGNLNELRPKDGNMTPATIDAAVRRFDRALGHLEGAPLAGVEVEMRDGLAQAREALAVLARSWKPGLTRAQLSSPRGPVFDWLQ